MRLIDADALYAKAAKLEKEAREDLLKCDFNKDHETWRKLNEILLERTAFKYDIADAPTIEERKTGKWIKHDNGTWSCSVCQSWIPNEQHYYARFCIHCGAKMK